MDSMTLMLDGLISLIGLDGATLLAALIAMSLVCQFVGRLIPDDATGWKGVVRKVCKVLGLYVSNRIASGTSVNDVAKAAASAIPDFAEDGLAQINRKIKGER